MSACAILVLALRAATAAQDAGLPVQDGFGRGQGAVDERAREDQRGNMREQDLVRAMEQAARMRQGVILAPGVRSSDDAGLAAARSAVGADAPRAAEVPVGLAEIVRRMDDAAWSVREQASLDAGSGTWTMPELRKALDGPALTLEQRSRLEEALWASWEARPRGAIGITMGQGPGGVLVTQVHDGFPASRVLRTGDVIVSIDGVPTPDNNGLVAIVQQRGPGDRLRLAIVRGAPGAAPAVVAQQPVKAERLDLEVQLGDFALLERMNPRTALRPFGRRAAFEAAMRAERERSALPLLPVEPGLPPGFVGSTVLAGGRQPGGTSVNPKMAINQLRNTLEQTKDPEVRALLEDQIARLEQTLRDSRSRGGAGVQPRQAPPTKPE